jgi:hypothetical protein
MKTGVRAGLEAAGGAGSVQAAADAREAAGGSQLDLLAENERLDDMLPLAAPAAKRGPGRPPGARNKRTQQLAAYYLGRYGDPLEALLAMGSGDLAHTHAALRAAGTATGLAVGDLTVMDLLRFKRDCLETVLPYLHARLAPTDDKGDPVVPILAIGNLRPDAAERVKQGGALDIETLIDITPGAEDEPQSDQ